MLHTSSGFWFQILAPPTTIPKAEFVADASAVKFTRYPNGLINALKKIKLDNFSSEKKVSKAIAPLFFSNPFKNAGGTHPPLEKRISVLERM